MVGNHTGQPVHSGRHEEQTQRSAGQPRVMLLGSEELSRELVIALQRLGAEVVAVERHADEPLCTVADRSVVLDFTDVDDLAEVIRRLRPHVVVAGADVGAADALTVAAEAGFTALVPNIRTAHLVVDAEAMRRLATDQLGLPTAPSWFVGSVDELSAVAEHVGFPMVVKPVVPSLGDGISLMVRPEDVEPAWQAAAAVTHRRGPDDRVRVLAETVVEADHEITLLTVVTDGPSGPTVDFCPPIGHRNVDGADGRLVVECWQPQAISAAALDAAKSVAARVVRALGGRGVFGVELLVTGDEVYFVGLTARPADTALLTLRTQRLSGFELQARAVLGLAVDTVMISPGAARLVYSARRPADAPAGPSPPTGRVPTAALGVAESDVVIFGYDDGHPRLRLALAVATAPDVDTARQRAARVDEALADLTGPPVDRRDVPDSRG